MRLYRGWRLELRSREQGLTIKRTVHAISLHFDSTPDWEEQLAGFSSTATAWSAAQKRVDFLMDMSGQIKQEYPWPVKRRA